MDSVFTYRGDSRSAFRTPVIHPVRLPFLFCIMEIWVSMGVFVLGPVFQSGSDATFSASFKL